MQSGMLITPGNRFQCGRVGLEARGSRRDGLSWVQSWEPQGQDGEARPLPAVHCGLLPRARTRVAARRSLTVPGGKGDSADGPGPYHNPALTPGSAHQNCGRPFRKTCKSRVLLGCARALTRTPVVLVLALLAG